MSGAHLQAVADRHRPRRRIRNRDESSRGRRGLQRDAEELQELAAVPLGDLIGAVEKVFGQKREDLDERDAGVTAVEVRPFRDVRRGQLERLAAQRVETAVVDLRQRHRHDVLLIPPPALSP